jgi:hypothetical protein
MKISWKSAAGIVPCLALSLFLAGCETPWHTETESCGFLSGCFPSVPDPQIWVSDSALSTWAAMDTSSTPMNVTPNASSMTYWQQGPDPEFASESQACPAIPDYCGELFFTNGGKLFAMNASAPGSTPTPVQVPTQFTAGSVVWGGAGGSYLYVTYPNNAAVGVIGGVSKTEHISSVINLPGTAPTAIAVALESYGYIISGSPPGAQQLVAFNNAGPIAGFATPSVSFANSLAANGTYVATISNGKLLVYRSDLSVWGTVSAPSSSGWNPYGVVIDQNSNMAYVTSLSAPTIAGQVNAVDLDALAIVGSAPVGKGPFNMRLSWDGSILFVANQNDGPPGTVSVFSAGAGGLSLQQTVAVGTKPGPLAIHP